MKRSVQRAETAGPHDPERDRLITTRLMAICSFWLVTMAAIWLFLLGWMSFLTGTFSTVEITLTFIIGAASLVGVLASQRLQRMSSRSTFLTIVVSSAVQAGALWFSYQPIIVGR